MTRLRKAWLCSLDGHDDKTIVYAEDSDKARARCLRMVREVMAANITQVAARRAPEHDVSLPDRHPLLNQISKSQAEVLLHALGGNRLAAGYRDHYYASIDNPELWQLVEDFGLMRVDGRTPDESGDDVYYRLTELGRTVALSQVDTYPNLR